MWWLQLLLFPRNTVYLWKWTLLLHAPASFASQKWYTVSLLLGLHDVHVDLSYWFWYIPLWASLQFHQILFLPYIGFAAIALPIYDFRAHPVGGASDRLDSCTRHADGLDTFAGSKVSQLHVPWWVSQDVRTWWNEKNKTGPELFKSLLRTVHIPCRFSCCCRLLQCGYKEPVPELRLTEQLKGKGKLFLWLWWWNTGRLISKMSKYCIPFSKVYINTTLAQLCINHLSFFDFSF